MRNSNRDLNIAGEPDLIVLDQTSEGRFAYTPTTQSDGTLCYSFLHNAHGGGGGCLDDPAAFPAPYFGSGWSSPEEASASVFVLSEPAPDIEFIVDGRALDPTIETGITDGVPWGVRVGARRRPCKRRPPNRSHRRSIEMLSNVEATNEQTAHAAQRESVDQPIEIGLRRCSGRCAKSLRGMAPGDWLRRNPCRVRFMDLVSSPRCRGMHL